MNSINELAEMSFLIALHREKTTIDYITHESTVASLTEEFAEFVIADEQLPSEHIPDVSQATEELTDILIVCMTELYRRDINVEKMIKEKIKFNQNRKD